MKKTRYKELSYMKMASGWRIIDNNTDSTVGPQYKTEAELLGDLNRFAVQFGCDPATAHETLNEDHRDLAEDIRSHVWTTFDSRIEFNADDIGKIAHRAEMAILDALVELGYGK